MCSIDSRFTAIGSILYNAYAYRLKTKIVPILITLGEDARAIFGDTQTQIPNMRYISVQSVYNTGIVSVQHATGDNAIIHNQIPTNL